MEEANGEHHRDNHYYSYLRLQKEEVGVGIGCHQHTTDHIPQLAPNAVRDGTEGWHRYKTDEGCDDETGVQQVEVQLQGLHTVGKNKGCEDIEGSLFSRTKQS